MTLCKCHSNLAPFAFAAEREEVDRLNGEVVQLHKQGRYAEALKQAQAALALPEKTLGPEHPGTATSLNNLGFLYQAMGQYNQALPLYQRALTIKEKVLQKRGRSFILHNCVVADRKLAHFL